MTARGYGARRRRPTSAYLIGAVDDPAVWLALLDGPSKSFQVLRLDAGQVLSVDPGVVVVGPGREEVRRKAEQMGYRHRPGPLEVGSDR